MMSLSLDMGTGIARWLLAISPIAIALLIAWLCACRSGRSGQGTEGTQSSDA